MDRDLRLAVDCYKDFTEVIGDNKINIYLDYIIRLTICRAYINNKIRMVITAEKLILLAEKLLDIYRLQE